MKTFTRIKGLSDARRLPRLGKLRKGIKVISGDKERPKEVSYWVCPPEVQAIYGEQPTEVDVLLPLDDPEVVFPQSYKLYVANQKVKCRGDGETAVRWTKDGNVEDKCPCDMLESGQCKQRGHLMVMLPRVSMGGCYQIDTGGINDIINLNSYIADDGFLRGLAGRIAMVPFKLRRVEVKRDDGTGKMMPHWDIQPIFEGNVDVVNAIRGNSERVLETAARFAIEAPKEEGPEPDTPIVQEPGGGDISPAGMDEEINDSFEDRPINQTEMRRLHALARQKGQSHENLKANLAKKLNYTGSLKDLPVSVYDRLIGGLESMPDKPEPKAQAKGKGVLAKELHGLMLEGANGDEEAAASDLEELSEDMFDSFDMPEDVAGQLLSKLKGVGVE